MKEITDEQAQEWIEVALEVADTVTRHGCKCATCRFLTALNSTRDEKPSKPKKSERHGRETAGHEDGCRCRECDPSW